VRPEQLFLDETEWRQRLAVRAVIQLSPFAAGESAPDTFDAGARPAKNFATERANPNADLFDAVRDYLDGERKSGRHAAIAAYTLGSADRLATVLRERGLTDLRRVADGKALARLPRSAVGLAILSLLWLGVTWVAGRAEGIGQWSRIKDLTSRAGLILQARCRWRSQAASYTTVTLAAKESTHLTPK